MTDDQSYGHVAVAFAEIARTSLRENGWGNVATDRRFRSPHRRGLRRGRYLSFDRVTGHHAGVLPPPRLEIDSVQYDGEAWDIIRTPFWMSLSRGTASKRHREEKTGEPV